LHQHQKIKTGNLYDHTHTESIRRDGGIPHLSRHVYLSSRIQDHLGNGRYMARLQTHWNTQQTEGNMWHVTVMWPWSTSTHPADSWRWCHAWFEWLSWWPVMWERRTPASSLLVVGVESAKTKHPCGNKVEALMHTMMQWITTFMPFKPHSRHCWHEIEPSKPYWSGRSYVLCLIWSRVSILDILLETLVSTSSKHSWRITELHLNGVQNHLAKFPADSLHSTLLLTLLHTEFCC